MTDTAELAVEAALRDRLAQGDAVLGGIGPILGHLLANQDPTLFSEEIVARVRGMAGHVAMQLLHAEAEAGGYEDPSGLVSDEGEALVAALVAHLPFLTHCHALALEWQLARRLEQDNAVDPVLSPLLQALIASDDANTAATAMVVMAAQARFMQQQRRMELSLAELPPELFHHAVATWRDRAGANDSIGQAEAHLRQGYDEGAGRIGLLARLVSGMGSGVRAALAIGHAGAALFLSALAAVAHQQRDLSVLSTNESQHARLALSLRHAGLSAREVQAQFLFIHPQMSLPGGFDLLGTERAGALLAGSPRNPVA